MNINQTARCINGLVADLHGTALTRLNSLAASARAEASDYVSFEDYRSIVCTVQRAERALMNVDRVLRNAVDSLAGQGN